MDGPQKTSIAVWDLIRRGRHFINDQYWLFLGITFVGMFLANAVPFGLIMGPMLVGINLCLLERERGEEFTFAKLFDGFDSFKESFIATLLMIAATIVVMVPLVGILIAGILVAANLNPNAAGNEQAAIAIVVVMSVFYLGAILACILVSIPFLFSFHLIADRGLSGVDAVKMSFRGVRENWFGIFRYVLVVTVISFALMLMCYVPSIFFMPIAFASLFLLYRDIFPQASKMTSEVNRE